MKEFSLDYSHRHSYANNTAIDFPIILISDHNAKVVGRIGFLDRLRVGIVDYEQLVYLGLYE